MNLELIDPFGRQIPDRIDSTLQLPVTLHFRQHPPPTPSTTAQTSNNNKSSSDSKSGGGGGDGGTSTTGGNSAKASKKSIKQQERQHQQQQQKLLHDGDHEWKAAYHLAFNRRGTYLAVGYGSGTVAVFNILSRSLSALYQSDDPKITPLNFGEGVTSVSWSRRSRTLLSGAAGDKFVRVYDTSHPFGPEECCKGLGDGSSGSGGNAASGGGDDHDDDGDTGSHTKGSGGKKDSSASPASSKHQVFLPGHSIDKTKNTSFVDADLRFTFSQEQRKLPSHVLEMGEAIPPQRIRPEADYLGSSSANNASAAAAAAAAATISTTSASEAGSPSGKDKKKSKKSKLSNIIPLKKHSSVSFEFYPGKDSVTVGGSLQINPRIRTGGVATLSDGSLVLFYFHPSAFISGGAKSSTKTTEAASSGSKSGGDDKDNKATSKDGGAATKDKKEKKEKSSYPPPKAFIIPLWKNNSENKIWITCAAFDHHGERVYAASRDGTLLGFDVSQIWKSLQAACKEHKPRRDSSGAESGGGAESSSSRSFVLPNVHPKFKLNVGGSSSAWHLLVSRNGKYLVVNSADGALRLYSTQACWTDQASVDKPVWTFQDLISKVKFACCDLSGDGEYVVGGANGDDNKYELYVWNTTTGALIDKLTGISVQLYSVAWHPTRPFIAAATSDGIVDIWGPRINWTAFAPDFQALPMNVEYIEREDEFDIDPDSGKYLMDIELSGGKDGHNEEDEDVDVLTVEKVPVFASDSENEEEVFNFETKVVNLLAERGGKKGKTNSMDD